MSLTDFTRPSIEPIRTRDQLFPDDDRINDESTEPAKKSKRRRLNLEPARVARVTRSKAKAKASDVVSNEAGKPFCWNLFY